MKTDKKTTPAATKKSAKPKKKVSALTAAAVARSATAQVRAHTDAGLATTGTNVSYEGPTAPGGGGSAGTGYASGKEATGAGISYDAEENVIPGRAKKKSAKPKTK